MNRQSWVMKMDLVLCKYNCWESVHRSTWRRCLWENYPRTKFSKRLRCSLSSTTWWTLVAHPQHSSTPPTASILSFLTTLAWRNHQCWTQQKSSRSVEPFSFLDTEIKWSTITMEQYEQCQLLRCGRYTYDCGLNLCRYSLEGLGGANNLASSMRNR